MLPCGYTYVVPHMCHQIHASYFCTLHAAEDEGGQTQHEGQQRERGLRLINILFLNKLNGEHIPIIYNLLVSLPRDQISNK